jgi:diamine N-acetyltransferase
MKHKELILRAPEPEDIDLLYNWENDTSMWQLSNTLTPFSRYTLKKYIESSSGSIYEDGQLRLMITLESTSKTVGAIDLFDFDPFNQRAGIGILIADKNERRKGYARVAIEAMIDYSFNRLKLHQLYCNILADNLKSINLFQGLGFTISGKKEEWIRSEDKYLDEYILQLINPNISK